MNTTTITTALDEVRALAAAAAPIAEGLRDYARLDVKDETRSEVEALEAVYDTWLRRLTTFIGAGEALMAADVPSPRYLSDEALADLDAQLATLTAARTQFKPQEAVTLTITPDIPSEQ